jgi:hypothetical protein
MSMANTLAVMLVASIIGALVGIYYATSLNPLNNYNVFMAFFAIIGVGIANIVLAALYRIYEWIKE